ncbi:MAG: hypothetical protein R3264_14800 [Anaerolineae bacterium]|nr:hypothetical protein [Anaerolineae bacterium]
MTPRVKFGLIAGGIGLVLSTCVSAAVGVCGPIISILVGAGAGYFTAQAENAPTRQDGAKFGAISGAIAGTLSLVGQLIGGLIALVFVQASGTQTFFGELPGDAAGQVGYWVGGLGFGLCLGIGGIILGGVAGAAAGYFGTAANPQPLQMDSQ